MKGVGFALHAWAGHMALPHHGYRYQDPAPKVLFLALIAAKEPGS